jgi:helicase SWR1
MQNGTPNGISQHHERVTPDPADGYRVPSNPDALGDFTAVDQTSGEQNDDGTTNDQQEGPPPKKRRLTESSTSRRSTPRPISPPWKKVAVDGPTSFFEGGRRKSSRTNALPLQLQPHSDKRQTRGSQKDYMSKTFSTRQAQHGSSPSSSTPTRPETGGRRSIGGKATTNGTVTNSPRIEPPRKSSRLSAGSANRAASSAAAKSINTRMRSQSSANSTTLSFTAGAAINGSSPKNSRRNASTSTITSPSANRDLDGSGDIRNTDGEEWQDVSVGQKLPRLRFKVRKPSTGVQHPSHVLPPRHHASFREWVESGDATLGEGLYVTPEDAREEAANRLRVLDAGEPGGLLTPEVCSACLPDPQDEPPQQYSHQDHLVAHALYFRKLLDQEHKRHRNMARLFAQWCAEAWRKRNKRPEDILQEQQEELKAKRRQLIKDLQKQFDLVRAEIERIRLARWEEEKKAEDQQALDRAIKQSTMLFEKRRQEILGELVSDSDDTSGDAEEDSFSSSNEDESNMSTTDTETESTGVVDDDEALTAEELRLKYANIPATDFGQDRMSVASLPSSNHDTSLPVEDFSEDEIATQNLSAGSSTGHAELDEVDPILLDDSDESTDMDDDMGESDGDRDSSEDEASEGSDDGPGLLGFFSSKNVLDEDGTADDDQEEPEEDQDEVSLVPTGPPGQDEEIGHEEHTVPLEDGDIEMPPSPVEDTRGDTTGDATVIPPDSRQSRDGSSQASPGTVATKPSDPESISSYEAPVEKPSEFTDSPTPVGLKTPIPHLLRGTLREYQHYGLDWLAGLYTNHINGILADEMGLGKTIQTIALLAHLAVEHEVWGPHLVVVPTSVILNWEMEFKKWCPGFKIMTYYGNQEERKQKRRGWMDDSSWDVLITSYQLVLQDQQVLKRRNWHYMVLDEAHNIKNFRSQRWQALLTFKTRARLLLTGTPLQNNLTELWSLLFFLMPSDGDEAGVEGFADLKNFSEWFRRPVEQILEHGRETMDEEAKRVVNKLHTVLRPYLLRRLKADVEKQMPAKYEHVVYCRLSKRQRYLYDGFMSRAQTKETLASGNYLSIINCLMQLRKVCNHPDLFETRQISTSFAMPKSVATEYEIKERLVRRRLLYQHPFQKLDLDFLNLVPVSREDLSRRLVDDSSRIMAFGPLKTLRERQYKRTNWRMEFDGSSVQSALESMENASRKRRMNELESSLYFESKRHGRRPVYGRSLIEFLTVDHLQGAFSSRSSRQRSTVDSLSIRSSILASMILSIEERARAMEGYIQRFACVTPAAVAAGITEAALTPLESRFFSREQRHPAYEPFHEAQMRLSIAFPDKRLLQYDCGKLQRLDKLLRDLQAGGHRALIFTQMTKMLDILEQFLNIHGHRYLRLDGTTKIEQRQMLTERFNNDNRILAFILSTRSGGLGINLTGADTVIFYDLDWNPAMDKQCQDRCHRIGQTRDVHIYRFVSEYTIESNILRKANQKRMLDDVVIQEGEFTTDYFTKLDVRDVIGEDVLEGQDEASKAMDRVLDTRGGGATRVFEQAEDKEDIDAAKNAQKELEHADDGDFEEHTVSRGTPALLGPNQVDTPTTTGPGEDDTPGPALIASPQVHGVDDDVETELQPGHIDDYLLRFMEWNLKDEPLQLPPDKSRKKSKRGKEHRFKRRR